MPMAAAQRTHVTRTSVGSTGVPATKRSPASAPATKRSVFGNEVIWDSTWELRFESEAERVTMMPVPTAMTSAGTCVTMPSPMVRSVYVWMASPHGRPRCITPMTRPPTMLMSMMMMPAMASPFTNLLAPSIAP